MRWRPGHLVLLLFQAFWLNVVVPGHTRGSVPLPGSCGEAAHVGTVADCCGGPDKSHPAPPKGHGWPVMRSVAER